MINHKEELSSFYHTLWKNVPDNFEQILALPRESLIADLENILIDSIQRKKFFETKKNEKLISFPIHAVYFLGYLESENSLDTILNVFRQGQEFLSFWYFILTTNIFTPVLFKMSKTKKEWDKLAQFLLEDNIYFEPKNIVTIVIKDLIIAEKMTREEGLSLFQSTIEHILKNINNNNFLDMGFITLMVQDIVSVRLVELLPLLKQLYDNNLVNTEWTGKYEIVEEKIRHLSNFKKVVYILKGSK